tara:strand:+ start:5039 stop:5224 length:186 start_codon:yes stop_codon:yes gene_type:complete
MKIQLDLNELNESDLEICKDILGSNTKTKCIKSLLYLFPILSKKYEKMLKENKAMKKKLNN